MSSAEFLENLLKRIVNSPEAVKVFENDTLLEVTADSDDLGIVIGKGGKNIRSFKNIINLKTAKEGTPRIEIKINEEAKTTEK